MFKGRASKLTRFISLLFTVTTIISCGGEDVATETKITKIDTTTPTQDWQLVWSDEFESSTLDMSKWSFEINCDGGGNAEEQCYTDSDENLFIDSGVLNIVARPTAENSELSKPYTSSRIVTKNQGDWKYGRIEVKAKPPKGQGSWAAAWMMPTESVYGTWPLSGEIDLVEWVNLGEVRADGDVDKHIHGTLHYGPMQGSNHSYTGTEYPLPNDSPENDFNLYAIEWEEGEIRWYVNDTLYAYQRDSEITYRVSDGAASGLSETGWYTQRLDEDGEKQTVYQNAPYDQNFFIILNNAVGGNWAGRVHQAANYFVGDENGTIAQGVDNSVFLNGNAFQVDYVRVYQCSKDLATGKGCATISADYYNDTYIKGGAPVPIPPIIPVPVGVDLFTEEQSAWDIFGSGVEVDSDDIDYGSVLEFSIDNELSEGAESGLSGAAYDGTLLPDEANIEFDLKVLSIASSNVVPWFIKVEFESTDNTLLNQGKKLNTKGQRTTNIEFVKLALEQSTESELPVEGQWQHYTFSLGELRALGLDATKIIAIKIFPGLEGTETAVYQLDNVTIGASFEGAKLQLFADQENTSWPMWDDQVSKGISSVSPVIVVDENIDYGSAAEFFIFGNSVVGFTSRQDQGGSGYTFDASSLAINGAIEFDIKLIDPPENPNAPWYLKIESNGGTNLGGTAVDFRLPEPPIQGQWKNYSVSMNTLLQQGLDISAIDIALIFPQWGQGDGAKFRVDNMIIHSTITDDTQGPGEKGPDNTVYQNLFTLYDEQVRTGWTLWDCCAYLPQVEAIDDTDHNMVVEFTIGEGSDGGTVVGFWGRSSGETLNLAPITNNGVLRFDLKIETMPEDEETNWLLKVESSNATGNTFAELNLQDSLQGVQPSFGEWQSYSFPLNELAGSGLNLTEVDLVMIFPEWGKGLGTIYRIDNVFIGIPESDENPYTDDSNDMGDDDTGAGNDNSDDMSVELLANASFDSTENWGGTDGMADSIADGVFSADVAQAGNPWDVSLKQNLTLLAETEYVLSFDARSDDSRDIIAGLGLDTDPWTNAVETVTLTTEWTRYTLNITTAGFGGESNRLFFDMGAAAGQVQLDNVSLMTVSVGDNADTTATIQTAGTAIIDFETVGNHYSWQTFENDSNPGLNIVINPAQDGVNDSDNVAKVTTLTTGQPWAGVQSAHGDFGPLTLDETNSTIKIMVYKSIISDVGIKFAIPNNGAQPEIKMANTLVNQWEELTFDFSSYIGLIEAINIDQIIIFPDFDTNGRSQNNIVYFDNIRFE